MQDKKKESDESNNKMKIRKIKKNTTLQTFIDQLESIFEQISLPPTLRGQSIDELGSLELASLARDSIQQKKLTTVLVPILINLLATQNASEAYFAIQQISRLVNPLQFSNENGNKDSHTLIQPYQKQIVVQTAIAFATNPLFFANLRQHLLINYPMRIHVAILSMLYWLSNACELIGDVSVLNQDQLRDSTVHKPICPFYCGDAIVGSNMIRITGNGDGIKPMQNSFRQFAEDIQKNNESLDSKQKNKMNENQQNMKCNCTICQFVYSLQNQEDQEELILNQPKVLKFINQLKKNYKNQNNRKKVKNDEKKKKNESKSNQKKNDKKEEEERKLKEKEKEKEIENKEKKKSKKPDKKEKQKQFLSTSLNDVQIRHRDMRYDDIRANLKSSGSRGRERSIERDNKSSFIRRENETYKDKDKKKRLGSVDVSEDQKHKSKHKRHNSVDAVQKKSNDKENQKDKERRKLIEELKIPEKNKKNDKSKQSDKDESKKDKQKEINKENEPPQKLIFESTDAQKQDLNATVNTSTSTNPENKHDIKQEDIKQPQQQDTAKDDKQQQQQTKPIQPSITDDTTAKQSKSPLPKSDSPSADSDERQGDSDMSDTSDTPQPTNISGDIEPQVQLQVSALGNKKEAMATFGVFDDREDDEDDEYMTQFSQGLGLRMQMYSGPGGNTEINAGKNINQQRVNDSMDDTQNSRNEKDKQKKKKKKKNQDGEDDSDSDSDSESSSSDDEDESNSSSEEDYDEEINTKETKTSVSQNKDDTTSSNKSKQDKKSKSKSNTRKTNQESGKSDKKERNDETQSNKTNKLKRKSKENENETSSTKQTDKKKKKQNKTNEKLTKKEKRELKNKIGAEKRTKIKASDDEKLNDKQKKDKEDIKSKKLNKNKDKKNKSKSKKKNKNSKYRNNKQISDDESDDSDINIDKLMNSSDDDEEDLRIDQQLKNGTRLVKSKDILRHLMRHFNKTHLLQHAQHIQSINQFSRSPLLSKSQSPQTSKASYPQLSQFQQQQKDSILIDQQPIEGLLLPYIHMQFQSILPFVQSFIQFNNSRKYLTRENSSQRSEDNQYCGISHKIELQENAWAYLNDISADLGLRGVKVVQQQETIIIGQNSNFEPQSDLQNKKNEQKSLSQSLDSSKLPQQGQSSSVSTPYKKQQLEVYQYKNVVGISILFQRGLMDDLSEIGFACINNNQSLINILKSNGSEYIKVIGSRLKDTLNEQIQTRKSSVKSSLQNSQHSHTSSITSSQQHVNQIPIITHVKQIYPLNEQDERKRIDNKLNKIGSKDNKEEKTEKEGMKSESIIKHHRSHSSDQTDGKDNKEKQIGQLSAIQQKVSSYTPQWTYSRKENLSEDQPKRIELPRSNLSSADSDVRSYQSTNSNKGSMKQSPKLKDNPNYHILKDLHSKGPFSDSPASLSSPQPITPGFNKNVNSAQYSSNMQPQSPNLYQTSISTPQPQHGQLEKAIQAEKELEREREKEKKEQEQDALTSNIQSELLNASKNLDQDKSQLKKKKVKDVDKDKDKNNQKNKTDEKEQNNSPSLIPEQPQSITKSEADKLKNRLKIFDIMQLQSLLLLHRYSPF